jgi:putative membrane protein
MTEALLAYAHFVAILMLVVFVTSEAALCRPEWMNAAVVRLLAAVAVLGTGLARAHWGVKGVGWYWGQPLLHAKVTLFALIGLMSLKPTFAFIRWKRELHATGALPDEAEVRRIRRWIMAQAHLLLVLPLLGAFLARGIWVR